MPLDWEERRGEPPPQVSVIWSDLMDSANVAIGKLFGEGAGKERQLKLQMKSLHG